MKISALLKLLMLSMACHSAIAESDSTLLSAPFELSSGEQQVALVELYTSEGCSSCPPADRWLSGLVDDSRLWRELVPVSFHVDYWDWIGWNDRFAHPDYSARQQQHIQEGNARVVYTPGFFANGREWRGFFERKPLDVSSALAGLLAISLNEQDVSVQFDPRQALSNDLNVHVALLGMGLETQVEAGENRGRTLRHDFVVLSLNTEKLVGDTAGLFAELQLPQEPLANARAIAAWVTDGDSQRPLQAVGGYLR